MDKELLSKTKDEEDEEAAILAKVGTTVANAARYEENVIRETVFKDAPRLGGIGFPDLSSLMKDCGGNNNTILSILNTLATKLQKEVMQQYDNETRSTNVLRMKYQILQSLLSTMNSSSNNTNNYSINEKKKSIFNIDIDKAEISAEKKRSVALKSALSSSSSNTSTNNNTDTTNKCAQSKIDPYSGNTTRKQVSFGAPSFLSPAKTLELAKKGLLPNDDDNQKLSYLGKQALLDSSIYSKSNHKRQSIMERKRKLDDGLSIKGNFDDRSKLLLASTTTTENYLVHLKELRKQRREARRRRRRNNSFNNNSDYTDINDDDTNATGHVSDNNNCSRDTNENTRNTCRTNTSIRMSSEEEKLAIVCPLCKCNVKYAADSNPDEVLSIHIDLCQQSQQHRRTTRSRTSRSSISAPQNPNSKKNDDKQQDNKLKDESLFFDDLEEDHNNSGNDVEYQPTSRRVRTTTTTTTSNKRKTTTDLPPTMASVSSSKKVGTNGEYNSSTRKNGSNCRDDLELWEYEDRVNLWIESGVSNMVSLPDPSEVLPGKARFPGGLTIPAWMNNRLFPYQRSALRWLWELYKQKSGSILGDEMGLGKTVQVASFLGAMISSRKLDSILLISPATMLDHWLRELSIWAPGLRRILIHKSAESHDGFSREVSSILLKKLGKWLTRARSEFHNEPLPVGDDECTDTDEDEDSFCGSGYVVITTYENLRKNADVWINHHWSMVVIDEGQKIKNPDADITLACKRLRTPHRLLVTATPISNDLVELWSLFDFVVPGRLGTLPSFEKEFADPIKRGGYANASPMQVQLAYRCALVLRDLVNPYMLRRLKKDIEEVKRLPGKTEHILFCRLSERQRILYEAYLESDEMKRVLEGSLQCFKAITVLRKICNHPDLVCDEGEDSFRRFVKQRCDSKIACSSDEESTSSSDGGQHMKTYESVVESCGKLIVLAKILPLWKRQGHRVLIFCQWKKMLNILQSFMVENGWKFARLDGNTCVGSRQGLVDRFNNDTSYFAMLLTTRTGGVGLNLVGANRCILWDPDWNPQIDAQARERSYRFGQTKEVTIYRLITAGTIEEKIYHRQIFKTALSERVLQDPKQRRMFSQKDLKDLFTLKSNDASGEKLSETAQLMKAKGVIKSSDSHDDRSDLGALLRSKGLAFVFDHDVVEESSSSKNKTRVDIEMEEKAKQAAERARIAVEKSGHDQILSNSYTPASTGAVVTQPSRFGPKVSMNSSACSTGNSDNVFGGSVMAAGFHTNVFGENITYATSANVLAKLRNQQ